MLFTCCWFNQCFLRLGEKYIASKWVSVSRPGYFRKKFSLFSILRGNLRFRAATTTSLSVLEKQSPPFLFFFPNVLVQRVCVSDPILHFTNPGLHVSL